MASDFYLTWASYSRSISSNSGVHSPGYASHAPRNPTVHSCQTIPLASLTSKPFFFFLSLSIPLRYQSTSSSADLLNESMHPHFFHSLHVAKPSENTFINHFVTPQNFLICAFETLSIILIPNIPPPIRHLPTIVLIFTLPHSS